ncbi:FUSC family protein [Romboutsia lituseburensis]|uniref:FUSC family protein n=1 Tax=Romboutsia lituseburensis TaxID=1537 RepID=UPI00215A5681|nr:FUSC family protein [Romboutsia lituseburensis]MCR8746325.1 FUSC family protein [Romboutsia lituseburensis]
MDKKTILSKTMLFIFIVAFVIFFKTIFGDENTLVGVTTITATLMLLHRDLTLSPLKNTARLIVLNLFIGISSVLAASNMWLGIPVNFITLFTISYLLCYSLRNSMYLPFSLQYLFLLANPIPQNLISIRLASLVFGALVIMFAQIIANKNKIKKSGDKILISICNSILYKIELLKTNGDISTLKEDINLQLNSFRSMIYDKRESDFYLTEEARIKLNLSVSLESINMLLDKINDLSEVAFIINNLELFLEEVKAVLQDNDYEKLSKKMKHLLVECEDEGIDDLYSLQMLDSIILLCDSIGELRNLDKSNFNKIHRIGKKPENFKHSIFKIAFSKTKSIRFCYAIRVATGITLGAFIMDYFKFTEGRWIVFTLLSLINPIYEVSKSKTKDRIVATLIGAVIILVLFGIFKDSTSRLVIIMLTGYISNYTVKYKYSMICTTVSAIGSAALVGNVQELTIDRILFVLIGMALAILINAFVLPYRLEDSINELKEMYDSVIKEMISEIYNIANGNKQINTIKNLFIITSFIENKAMLNSQISKNEISAKIIKEQRLLVTNVYELYTWIAKEKINPKYANKILSSVNQLIINQGESLENKFETIQKYISEIKDLKTKITLSSVLIILQEIKEIKNLNLKAQI